MRRVVADHAVRVGRVAVRAAVLGDLDDGPVVVARHAHQHVVERVGPDLPAEVGAAGPRVAADADRERAPRPSGPRAPAPHERARVEVDADEVERRAHARQVAARARPCVERAGRSRTRPGSAPRSAGSQEPEVDEARASARPRRASAAVSLRGLARRHVEGACRSRQAAAHGAHRAERLALREVHGVRRAQERVEVAPARRVDADQVAEQS